MYRKHTRFQKYRSETQPPVEGMSKTRLEVNTAENKNETAHGGSTVEVSFIADKEREKTQHTHTPTHAYCTTHLAMSS